MANCHIMYSCTTPVLSYRQEDDIYEDALIDADGAAQFDFRSELSTSKKGLLMATSPTDLFMHSARLQGDALSDVARCRHDRIEAVFYPVFPIIMRVVCLR